MASTDRNAPQLTSDELIDKFRTGQIPQGIDYGSAFNSSLNLVDTAPQTMQSDLISTGNITCNRFVVSSSVINKQVFDVSGSTFFGNSLDDVHENTGSFMLSGSFKAVALATNFYDNAGETNNGGMDFGSFKIGLADATAVMKVSASMGMSGSSFKTFAKYQSFTDGAAAGGPFDNNTEISLGGLHFSSQDASSKLRISGSIESSGSAFKTFAKYQSFTDGAAAGGSDINISSMDIGGLHFSSQDASSKLRISGSMEASGSAYKSTYTTTNIYDGPSDPLDDIVIGGIRLGSTDATRPGLQISASLKASASAHSIIGDTTIVGTLVATALTGDGSGLTGLSAGLWSGSAANPRATGDVQITGSLDLLSGTAVTTFTSGTIDFTTRDGSANIYMGTDGLTPSPRQYGSKNIVIGRQAGIPNSATHAGTSNIFMGYLSGNNSGGNCAQNIGIGASALRDVTSNDNIGIGGSALGGTTTGDKNIGIGRSALYGVEAGTNNIHIGDNIGVVSGQAYQLKIGDNSIIAISASLSTGDVLFPSTASAAYFTGDGSKLTNLPAVAGGLWSGSAADIRTGNGATVGITGSLLISGSLTTTGNISASSFSLGLNDKMLFDGEAGNTYITDNGPDSLEIYAGGSQKVMIGANFALNNFSAIQITSTDLNITAGGSITTVTNITASGAISASGGFIGDGSALTGLPAASPFPLSGSAIISSSFTAGDTNSNVLKLIGSGSISGSGLFEIQGSTGTLFSAVDSMSGSLMAVTDASGIPILEVFSNNTVTANGFKGWRPIETRGSSFVLQLTDIGTYNRCHGQMTASLSASSAIPFPIGTEIEFVQTSSLGNLYITASNGSGITLNSKNNNQKLAGQWSAATIKKVGTDEWDIVGDLT
jgi:hypothetical protein